MCERIVHIEYKRDRRESKRIQEVICLMLKPLCFNLITRKLMWLKIMFYMHSTLLLNFNRIHLDNVCFQQFQGGNSFEWKVLGGFPFQKTCQCAKYITQANSDNCNSNKIDSINLITRLIYCYILTCFIRRPLNPYKKVYFMIWYVSLNFGTLKICFTSIVDFYSN